MKRPPRRHRSRARWPSEILSFPPTCNKACCATTCFERLDSSFDGGELFLKRARFQIWVHFGEGREEGIGWDPKFHGSKNTETGTAMKRKNVSPPPSSCFQLILPTQLSDLQNPGEGTGLAIWCGIEVSNKFKQECLLGKRWDQRKCTSKMTPRLYAGGKKQNNIYIL